MEDREILLLYQTRDERAIAATMEKYGKRCLAMARNIVSNEADAEECLNDAYLALWNQIPPCVPLSLSAFLLRIVRNICLDRCDYITAAKRDGKNDLPLGEIAELLPDRTPEAGAIADAIDAFLAQEKLEYRRIFVRRYFFCDTVRDIAARYVMSESRVKSILFRERKKLKAYLQKEGLLS